MKRPASARKAGCASTPSAMADTGTPSSWACCATSGRRTTAHERLDAPARTCDHPVGTIVSIVLWCRDNRDDCRYEGGKTMHRGHEPVRAALCPRAGLGSRSCFLLALCFVALPNVGWGKEKHRLAGHRAEVVAVAF